MYHVLIFHKGGQYSLDIAGEEGRPTLFTSLDDLVVFCMSHQMKMEGDEVWGTLQKYSCIQSSKITMYYMYIVKLFNYGHLPVFMYILASSHNYSTPSPFQWSV